MTRSRSLQAVSPRDLRRAVARHRVLLAAGLAAATVATGLTAVSPEQEPVVPVLIASRDLAAGAELAPEDLAAALVPTALVPAGALLDRSDALGRLVAGPVRRGEPLTDVRLLGAGLLEAGLRGAAAGSDDPAAPRPDDVAVPLRLTEPAVAALVRAGDRVDVLSASPEGGPVAPVVATAVRVLSVPSLSDDPTEGALLVVAANRATASRLAAAAVTGRLSIVLLPP